MNHVELKEHLKQHILWLCRNKDGKRADLSRADLSRADLPTGETFEQYLTDVVPGYLASGGKQLADAPSNVWECHDWSNCPTAWAFTCNQADDVPILLWPRRDQFIQMWDAKLLSYDSETQTFVPTMASKP